MKIPPPTKLKPLDLTRGAVAQASKATAVQPKDLDPTQRLVRDAGGDAHDRLTKQARVWVSQTFFGTLLKQMEESPFKSELFSGGRGGQAFSSLYHQQLVERMSRTGAGERLVQSIVKKIESRNPEVGVQSSGKSNSSRPQHEPFDRLRGAGRRSAPRSANPRNPLNRLA